MQNMITIQHTQSIHHTNGMIGSWTDWDLSECCILVELCTTEIIIY
jgi:hypothetical protein